MQSVHRASASDNNRHITQPWMICTSCKRQSLGVARRPSTCTVASNYTNTNTSSTATADASHKQEKAPTHMYKGGRIGSAANGPSNITSAPSNIPSGFPSSVAAAAAIAAVAAAAANSKNTNLSAKYRPFMDAWDKGFEFNAREEPWGVWLQVTEGSLPPQLVGTYFRNGPGRFRRGPDSHVHPLDGDGLVTSVAFAGNGSAFFRSAFVRTLEHNAEDLAGRLLFRGALGTRRRGGLLGNAGDLTLRNAANTGVVLQGRRLLATYPGGLPYALDPATLATRGPDLLSGTLNSGLPLSLGHPAADRLLSRLNRALGYNVRLPPAHTALGGEACTARPRTCGVTGRRLYWSLQHVAAGMPEEGSAAAADAGAWLGAAVAWAVRPAKEQLNTVVTFWEVDPSAEEERGEEEQVEEAAQEGDEGQEEGRRQQQQLQQGVSARPEQGNEEVHGAIRWQAQLQLQEQQQPQQQAAEDRLAAAAQARAEEVLRLMQLQHASLVQMREEVLQLLEGGGQQRLGGDQVAAQPPPPAQQQQQQQEAEEGAQSQAEAEAVGPRGSAEGQQEGEQGGTEGAMTRSEGGGKGVVVAEDVGLQQGEAMTLGLSGLAVVDPTEAPEAEREPEQEQQQKEQQQQAPVAAQQPVAPAPAAMPVAVEGSVEGDGTVGAAETQAAAADGGAASSRRKGLRLRYSLSGFAAAPDVALTANYYLLLQPPVHVESVPYLLGETGPAACMRWRKDEASLLHVIPRPGSEAERRGERPVVLPLNPPCCALHHVNAFEDDSQPGLVVLDSVVYDSLPAVGAQPLAEQVGRLVDPDAGCKARLQRMHIDLATATVRISTPTPGTDRHLELPAFNTAYTGRRHRFVYGCSVVFEDASCGLVKADMDTMQLQRWAPGPGYLCLEPCFVPRLPATAARPVTGGGVPPRQPLSSSAAGAQQSRLQQQPLAMQGRQRGEDDGWLVCYGFDSTKHRSELLVFDAWGLAAGPVARLALPEPLPHGLYGTWADTYFGPVQQ